ncbi:MAG: hypothetical protein RLY16_1370, partial [Bacteroidota bacterium]
MIQIIPVASKRQLADFIDFPHDLYADDNNYVPELHIAQRDLLTPGKHPFHDHSKVQPFLAYRDNKIVGRIAAIFNTNHNAFNNKQDGFFGFFDAINEVAVAKELVNAAENWLREKGANTMIGPVNPSTNDPVGLLIEGFDLPPVAMMTYNKPYYLPLLEAVGLKKDIDLLAYDLKTSSVDKRSIQLKEVLQKRFEARGITVRPINLKDFKNEVEKILKVYNAAWAKNTGFVPMTDAEFKYLAKDLKMILDKDFCSLAEKNGEVIGFALAIPDINQVLKTIKRGRLFPFGIFKLLFGLKKVDYVRVLALGITEEHRRAGVEAYFY